MKKSSSVISIIIGITLLSVGLFLKIPGTDLTTLSWLDGKDNYSVIEEYVGGDAYNYIIGASLVGGKTSGILVMKAVFIAVGALVFCMGLISLSFVKEKENPSVSTQPNLTTFDASQSNGLNNDNSSKNENNNT